MLALRRAVWKAKFDRTRLGGYILIKTRRVVKIDLKDTIEFVKVLEALSRCALKEAIVVIDDDALVKMHKEREIILRHIEGGHSLLIIASCARFYLRLFTFTTNAPLKHSIFRAMRWVPLRSPLLLDLIDLSAVGDATLAMLHAAHAHDAELADAAFDLLLGEGPLKRV